MKVPRYTKEITSVLLIILSILLFLAQINSYNSQRYPEYIGIYWEYRIVDIESYSPNLIGGDPYIYNGFYKLNFNNDEPFARLDIYVSPYESELYGKYLMFIVSINNLNSNTRYTADNVIKIDVPNEDYNRSYYLEDFLPDDDFIDAIYLKLDDEMFREKNRYYRFNIYFDSIKTNSREIILVNTVSNNSYDVYWDPKRYHILETNEKYDPWLNKVYLVKTDRMRTAQIKLLDKKVQNNSWPGIIVSALGITLALALNIYDRGINKISKKPKKKNIDDDDTFRYEFTLDS
ncbi:MAG TPA: hypothetical protein PKL04_06085 [Methanofastidiosum sp.]|nr:hypothetical protein [Methanofastidiosum sp.]